MTVFGPTHPVVVEAPFAVIFGIDPGMSGAIAAIDMNGNVLDTCKLDQTETDIADWLMGCRWVEGQTTFAFLERAQPMPKQGVSSTFKFGTSYGFLRGLLIAMHISFETVLPREWQGTLRCLSHGNKNVTKAKAQELFNGRLGPLLKITHATADALLIAEYGRRKRQQHNAEVRAVAEEENMQ